MNLAVRGRHQAITKAASPGAAGTATAGASLVLLQVPPIRTDLQEPQLTSTLGNQTNVSPNGDNPQSRTSKEWYYYWDKTGQQVNQNTQKLAGLVTYGTHAGRPDPSTMPDGALYFETDRGVLYQLRYGLWWYLAGVMYSTLTPDMRPTDLGTTDGGFEFGSTDTSPPRHFIWSQTQWVDVSTQWVNGTAGAISYSGGPVGIGTTNPVLGLDVLTPTVPGLGIARFKSTGVNAFVGIDTTGTGGASGLDFYLNGVWMAEIGWYSAGLTFWTQGASAAPMTISPNGSVDIVSGSAQVMRITGSHGNNINNTQLRFAGARNGDLWALGPDMLSANGSMDFYLYDLSRGPSITLQHGTGYIGIGTSSPTYQLQLSLDSAAKPATNTWTIVSDVRTKRNIRPLEGGLAVIERLEPIVAEYNGRAGTPADTKVVSLDPAKLRDILPDAVSSMRAKLEASDAEETDILGVNTHEILYHLVLAVQQLAKKTK